MAKTEGRDPADPAAPRSSLVHARLRLALDAAGMGLWDWDLDTGRLVWDERSAQMFGTTLADATGDISDVDARVHPHDLERVRAVLTAAIEAAGAVDVDFRTRWPDGTVRWLHASGRAVVDETGRTTAVIGINVDVTERREAARERIADAQRMAGLVGVAQSLGEAQTESDVLSVVAQHGSAALGARGTGLALRIPGADQIRLLLVGQFSDAQRAELAVLPPDTPLAAVDAAVSGRTHYLPTKEAAYARFPGAERMYVRAGTEAAAAVPLRARGELLGSLSVGFGGPHAWRRAERELLETLAALTAQALDRLAARRAEREAACASRRLSETLQRSLLTEPAALPLVDLAVRYQSAAQEAQVGGDWYDAFLTPNGGTTVVVGDVAGHDQDSAAAMAQVRNVLRGVAVTADGGPAAILRGLDLALERLQVPTLATAVLGRLRALPADAGGTLEPESGEPDRPAVVLTWCNAGHPPPLLLSPDGGVEMLAREPDLLLGLLPGDARTDHELPLPAGSTVLLYTDGLVERRGQSLDDGLDRLAGVAAGLAGLGVQDLADAVLAALAGDAEDDVVLLVARVVPPSAPACGVSR